MLLQETRPATIAKRAEIVAALEAEGVEVEAYCAAGCPQPTRFSMAHRFTRDGYQLSYRLLEPNWVLIAMYKRVVERPVMRDAFHTMAWFIDLLRRWKLGIEYVLGRVDTDGFGKGGDLDDDRLLRYYLRWGGASLIPVEEVPGLPLAEQWAAEREGIRYVKVGVADFVMPKQRAQARRRAGLPSGSI